MSQLLTTKQIQDLLKVDRVTVYRMLNDGRLKGVKVGNQWRFPQVEIDRLLGGETEKSSDEDVEEPINDFPIDCVQRLQEIFAGILGIGAVTVTLKGVPLTDVHYSNPFCKLMLNHPTARLACKASWRKIAMHSTGEPAFQTCHAGLSYMRAMIHLGEKPVGWLISGQFYTNDQEPDKEKERLEYLAGRYDIPLNQLTAAASKIPVLKRGQQEQVQEWTPKVANTVDSFLCERSEIMDRLQRIAELSNVHQSLSKSS